MREYKWISTPLKVNETWIKNRIVVPPMADFGMTEKDGYVNGRHLRHYRAFADGGAGLIIIEACVVSRMHEPRNTLRVYDDRYIPGLESLANAGKKNGSVCIVQLLNNGLELMHENRIADISRKDFLGYKKDFISAAVRCKTAGFDGVELHAAHGFYLNQVIETSMRDDEYGGELENRVRLIQELITEIKKKCGKQFLVSVRFGSCDKEKLLKIAEAVESAGGDILDISTGTYNYREPPEDFPYDRKLYAALLVKKHAGIPVIGVGGIRTGEQAEAILEKGIADMAAVGRGHLCCPDWTNRALSGQDTEECLNCGTCMWYIDGRKCPVVKKRIKIEGMMKYEDCGVDGKSP